MWKGQATLLTTLLIMYWLVGSLIAGSLILAAVLSGRLGREKPEARSSVVKASTKSSRIEIGESMPEETPLRKRGGAAAFAD